MYEVTKCFKTDLKAKKQHMYKTKVMHQNIIKNIKNADFGWTI